MTVELEHNQLLAWLPTAEKQELARQLQPILLRAKQELNSIGSPIRYLYFPLDAAISVMEMQTGGRLIEVAVVGKEGCSCPSVFTGLTISPSHTIVQIGGQALRLNVTTSVAALSGLTVFIRTVQRFSAVLFRQAVISVGCSQWHSVEQRLARWLLAHHERTGDIILPFTHEFLAEQLGSQRTTVTEALCLFQGDGLVRHGYGKVELIDIDRLTRLSCECLGLAAQAIQDYLRDIQTYDS